ncbi:MAG TPA: transglutaminase domain-containing protein [Acidimicrobiia bacterium]|nr:transglutaminase domain-containing protein [Acidimicrobiia bacterium]
MGRRLGQLAGILAFVLMIGRLGRLFLTGRTEPQWQLILLASAFLGAVGWWLLSQLTQRLWLKLVIFVTGGTLLALRIIAPETLVAGILPTGDTLAATWEQLDIAFRIVQSGVPPVGARPGLLAALAGTMWAIGALFTWGTTGGPYAAMFLPSLVMYLQFAVFDRIEGGVFWMIGTSLVLGLSVVSLALERREETGRARDSEGRPLARRSAALAGIMAVALGVGSLFIATNASAVVSEYGTAPWRGSGSGGYGSGQGGFTADRLVDLQQRVISRSNTPVFEMTLGAGAPPPGQIYTRMETLDEWVDTGWTRSDTRLTRFEEGRALANEFDIFQGPSYRFVSNVRIQNLRSEIAPTAGVPVNIHPPPDETDGRLPNEFQVLSDSALYTAPILQDGDAYTVETIHADRTSGLGALATGEDGQLTPMFAAAAEGGDFPYEPQVVEDPVVGPSNLGFYTEYPANLPVSIRNLARAQTARASSDFEKAFLLEAFFQGGEDGFVYDDQVSTGTGSLVLEDWLTDSTSQNYRTGYCEQFAAAMALMARTIDLPSRVVWGFTPGEVEIQDNGDEKVVVRDRNAHAWVEIWLEPFGWTMFDPTPRAAQTDYAQQPPSITAGFDVDEYLPEGITTDPDLALPEGNFNLGGELDFTDPQTEATSGGGTPWWILGIVVLVPLLAAIPVFKMVRRRRRLARIRQGDITAAWDEIVDRLSDLGEPISAAQTPLELARSTDDALIPLATSYASTVYGGRSGQARDSDLYGAEWWLDRTYDTPRKVKAAFSLRSLFKRD